MKMSILDAGVQQGPLIVLLLHVFKGHLGHSLIATSALQSCCFQNLNRALLPSVTEAKS